MEGIANFGKVCERPVEIGHLTAHELPDVWARSPSRPLDGDDLPDLLQREAEPLGLADEREQVERVATVHAVAGRRAPGRGQNPRLLVQPQCLPARAAAPRDLTDQEPVSPHDHHDKPGPVGEGQEVESVWSLLEVERRLGGERYRSCRTQVLGDRVGLIEPEARDVTVPLVASGRRTVGSCSEPCHAGLRLVGGTRPVCSISSMKALALAVTRRAS